MREVTELSEEDCLIYDCGLYDPNEPALVLEFLMRRLSASADDEIYPCDAKYDSKVTSLSCRTITTTTVIF